MGKREKRDYVLQIFLDISKSEFLHMGYSNPDKKIEALHELREAMQNYTDKVLGFIPDGVKTILDVGCGTGEVSYYLTQKGYSVECLNPDHLLEEKIREKYGDTLSFYRTKFENFDIDRSYDLILMMESSSYIDLNACFRQCRRYLDKGGFVLVSDFFRLTDEKDYKDFHVFVKYMDTIKANGLEVISSEDITLNTVQTLEFASLIYSNFALKTFNTIIKSIIHSLKIRPFQRFLFKVLSFLLRRPIRKARYKIFDRVPALLNSVNYREKLEYRILLLQRT